MKKRSVSISTGGGGAGWAGSTKWMRAHGQRKNLLSSWTWFRIWPALGTTGVVGQIPKRVRNDIKGNTVIASGRRLRGNPFNVGTAPRVKRHRSRLQSKTRFRLSRARLYTRQALFRGSARLGLHHGRNTVIPHDNRRCSSDNASVTYRQH